MANPKKGGNVEDKRLIELLEGAGFKIAFSKITGAKSKVAFGKGIKIK